MNLRTKPILSIFLALVLVFTLQQCNRKTENTSHKKWKIVTTTGMIKDAVSRIAGDSVEVIALMGPGVDPHLYKATQGDLDLLSNADLILYSGLHLEGKMSELFEKFKRTKNVVAVSDDIDRAKLIKPSSTVDVYDPHIWFDVSIWREAVEKVGKSLIKLDSIHSSMYQKNMEKYLHQLDSLHIAIQHDIQSIPSSQRILITAHDAFGYFGRVYKIEVKGLQGISTMSDFGLKDVSDLVNLIIKRKIKAVFLETSVSEKSIRSVVEGCKAKGHRVKIGGSLYSDAMGAEGTFEGTYIGMVSHNVKLIVESLK